MQPKLEMTELCYLKFRFSLVRSLKDQSDKRRRFVCKTSESRRADEGGAKEVRMMIMGPDPAQDNLTVHKLLSDTEAPVTQLAEESFGSSLSKRPGLVCGSCG